MKVHIFEFLAHCKFEKNLNAKTLKAYKIDLKQFHDFLQYQLDKNPSISEITKEEIKAYIAHLVKKYEIKSVKRKLASAKAFFSHLEFEDKIAINPFRKVRIQLKEPFRLPIVLEMAEIRRLFKVVYKEKRSIKSKTSFRYQTLIRDIAVLELLFATGIRVGELCGLRSNRINLHEGFIKVDGKGNKERVIQLCNKELLKALKEYRQLSSPKLTVYFFHNRLNKPLSTQSVRFMIRKYVAKANITKTVTPHCFRHTFATMLLEEGVDIKYIQRILGHSSILTTQIYTHVSNQKQREILASKHPRNRLVLG